VRFTHQAQVALTVHRTTVIRPAVVRFDELGDEMRIEAVGQFRFTDFGIEPYSAFLGAVKHLDGFYVYVNFTATRDDRDTQ